jgi:sn-glycerol 3-phosphate transport system permease protein
MAISVSVLRPGLVERILQCLGLVAFAAISGLPFFWMIITSLKSPPELSVYPPAWIPAHPRIENYVDAWNAAPFEMFYINSVVTATAGAFFQVLFAALMAYAFAWIRFPAKPALLLAVLATMMIPEEMRLVPNYQSVGRLGWIDTYWGLVIPQIAHAFPVFVLYQHFRGLSLSLIESARLDGAGHLSVLFRIILPISRPVLAATALVAFIGRWNDYLWPLVVTSKASMRTLPVGLGYLKGSQEGGEQWNLLMSATIFVIIPVLLLFLLAQRQFVEGLTRGALKG